MKILNTVMVKYVEINTVDNCFKVNEDGRVWLWEDGVWMNSVNFFEDKEIKMIAREGLAQFKLDEVV